MSKHPKRSRHRVPPLVGLVSDPIDERYQVEVDVSTARLEQRYRRAEKALRAAEAKAERVRVQIERLAEQQAEATRIAVHRAQEQSRLLEHIEAIKTAARQSRVTGARAELERKQREAVARRDAATRARKAEAKAAREREAQIVLARRQHAVLEVAVTDRRAELREIQMLMQPEGYGRDTRRRHVRQESGSITIPLGATTGIPLRDPQSPVFPVTTKRKGP